METKPQFAFLKKLRFWTMVIAALVVYLQQKGLLGTAEMQLIATITGGFTIVGTIDRNIGDKKVEAAVIEGEKKVEAAVEATR